jgi:hypothetical protein
MYIFLSHSARDKQFVRLLADSLAFYGIPIFFDEREIKVGDNIPAKIYDGLERATHVIYVLSNNSIRSEWVKEELSVAKMRQMDKRGCRILPVLIDNVSPPSSISHIRYADFNNWELKEYYLQALQELLISLDLKPQYSSSTELHSFQKHLNHIVKIMAFSNSASQTYFQLERISFNFRRQRGGTRHWFDESVSKTWDFEGFKQAFQALNDEFAALGSNSEKIRKVLDLCKTIENDYSFLIGGSDDTTDAYYERIWKAEISANELSAMLYSIILELQGMILS